MEKDTEKSPATARHDFCTHNILLKLCYFSHIMIRNKTEIKRKTNNSYQPHMIVKMTV